MNIHIFAAIFLCTNMVAVGSGAPVDKSKARELFERLQEESAQLVRQKGQEVTDFEQLERSIINQLQAEKQKKTAAKFGKG